MTIEAKLKQIIGEQTFTVVVLQSKIEELTAENEKLKAQIESDKSTKEPKRVPAPAV